MEIGIKFIKESFQLIPVDSDLWDIKHTQKNPTAKEKNTKFFPTFQTLSIIRNQLHLFL